MPDSPPAASRPWTAFAHDVRYALRVLSRRPGVALVAVLTMALGIGASTTLFSITDGVLLKPLPWPDPDRLVRVAESRQGHNPRIRGTITNGTYLAWRARPETIEEIGGWRSVQTTAIAGAGEPTRLGIAAVTPSIFTVLKATPLRGRLLVDADAPDGGSASSDVIVLSYGLWQERFGGRDEAIGTVMQVSGKPATIVGVMPRDFAFPTRETRAWTPWAVPTVRGEQNVLRMVIFSAMARLRPGVAPAQAASEGTARARSAPDPGLTAVAMFGGSGPAEIAAVPAAEMMTADVKPALLVLFGAVALLLAIATANVASLQLARAAAKRREMAIRAAIGAGAGRLMRQLLVESGLIGVAGGAAGLLLALALHRAVPALLPADFPRADEVAVDARAMLFALAVTLASSVTCGLLPAFQARRMNLVETLADSAASAGLTLHSAAARARTAIIVGQIALSCVLLVGAVLLTRSFVALLHADRGYDPRNLLTAQLPVPTSLSLEQRMQLLERLAPRLQSVPGVTAAAFGNALPLLTSGGFHAFRMRPPIDPSREVDVNTIQRVVSPGYFAALGLRVIAGRTLADTDTMSAPQVIVVNRSFAAAYLGADAIGATVPNLGMCRGDHDRWQVVGVVDDMRQSGVGEPPQPEIFLPYRQIGCEAAMRDPVIVMRTSADPSGYVATLRGIVRETAPLVALDSVMTMEERLTTSLAKPRLYAVVLSGFGAFALAMTAVGLFGVLSYSVALRAKEIGVRAALGARPASIVLLVLRQMTIITAAGLGIGLTAAAVAVRSISKALYGVAEHDLPTFAAVAVALAVISLLACVVPARRAATLDPIEVLRAG
jgi:putative ABC transport system permease protein